MNVRNCRKCGRVFNYAMGAVLCPHCREKEEEKFQTVKAYVFDHKGADINEVSEACEVSASQIRQWIREDRLQFADDCPIRIPCERCGAMIRSGRYCDKCNYDIAKELGQIRKITLVNNNQNKTKSSDRDKMRFIQGDRRDR